MKKFAIFILFLFLFISPISLAKAETNSENFICIANYCYLYSSPTFSSTKVYNESGEIEKIIHKQILDVECEDGVPVLYEDNFYKVLNQTFYISPEGEECDAYVYIGFVTKKLNYITTKPNYNASINTDNVAFYQKSETKNDENFALLDDGSKIYPISTIEFGTRIYLYQGFNSELDYTAIAVEIDDELLYGYVETTKIQPDGVNPLIIYAVTIALGCIGIMTALLLMKNKKKKVT